MGTNCECKCLKCDFITQVYFEQEDVPLYGDRFLHRCKKCCEETVFTRVLTKRLRREWCKTYDERVLADIAAKCSEYGFTYRVVFQSVVIQTPLSKWSFDFHVAKKTLYHENAVKYNRKTGNYAQAHAQFRDRRMRCTAIIDFIAAHEQWKLDQKKLAE